GGVGGGGEWGRGGQGAFLRGGKAKGEAVRSWGLPKWSICRERERIITIPHYPFPIPHSPLPIPHYPFPITHSPLLRDCAEIKSNLRARAKWDFT
ncbi:hypothetical protein, partial [Tolypothrix sp. VBCCA 56010]|uniref:hypothetical protein n=1 Tax=Tolypothrix sp. VBCCA 56010 TaxID=3137731 RepID=UPI003D7CEBE7